MGRIWLDGAVMASAGTSTSCMWRDGFFSNSLQSETAKAIFGQFSLKNVEFWYFCYGRLCQDKKAGKAQWRLVFEISLY